MFDEDINSNCDSENETYWDFKFWQAVKELAGEITDIVIDILSRDNDNKND
jgi:hypothetical protein